MEENDIHVLHHSAYRVKHRTETSLLKIHNDISRAISSRRKVILVLLDLSAAFHTLNHDILMGRLRSICLPDSTFIIAKHGVHFHMYADDTQLYLDFSPEDEVTVHAIIDECVKEIKAWLSDNFLLLSENKTEAITVMPVNQPAVAKSIELVDVTVPLSSTVTNLSAVFDKKCRMEEHATRVCRSANYYLQRI